MSDSFLTPWTVAYPGAPLSMDSLEVIMPEWMSFPFLGIFPLGIKTWSHSMTDAAESEPPREVWEPGKLNTIIQSVQRPENQKHPCPRAEEMMSQNPTESQVCPSSTFVFCSP